MKRLLIIGLILGLVWACAHGRREAVPPTGKRVEVGWASWYGEPFHGRKTASGAVYDMYQLTAAHKTLPLGTRVMVTHLTNGNAVAVTVNDRGPFVGGRIIDLSYAAAQALGMAGEGVAQVRVEVVDAERISASPAEGPFTVQVGSFADRANAGRLMEATAEVVSGCLPPGAQDAGKHLLPRQAGKIQDQRRGVPACRAPGPGRLHGLHDHRAAVTRRIVFASRL